METTKIEKKMNLASNETFVRGELMKIIAIDNYNRENVADILIAENVSAYWGERIIDLLLEKEHVDSPYYFKLVDDDYALYYGEGWGDFNDNHCRKEDYKLLETALKLLKISREELIEIHETDGD